MLHTSSGGVVGDLLAEEVLAVTAPGRSDQRRRRGIEAFNREVIMRHGTALLSLSGLVALLAGAARPAPNRDMVPARLTAEDVLRRTKALYPALRSYSDSGTVKTESSGSITTHSYFRTYL
jgi:hypothetical protein